MYIYSAYVCVMHRHQFDVTIFSIQLLSWFIFDIFTIYCSA